MQLIKSLLIFGNPIQLATKRRMAADAVSALATSRSWDGQLSVYISCATITRWSEFERGTQPPQARFLSFQSCRAAGIPAYLYVKPVLAGVTLFDAPLFGELMRREGVAAIVGDLFTTTASGTKAPISEKLAVSPDPDVKACRDRLSGYGRVYANSTEAVTALLEGSE